MNISLRKVGNSQAVIIPKHILLQLGFKERLEMKVVDDQIILNKPKQVRQGWEVASQQIAQAQDDELLLDF